jgi:hypothetical protein
MSACRRLRFVALGLLALALVLLPTAAAAAPPRQHFSDPIDETFPRDDLSAICGFAVTQTNVGTVHGWFVEEADGTFVADNVHVQLTGTFTGPTGKTVTFVLNQQIKDAVGADGSFTVEITGVLGRATVPGQGKIGFTLGRLVLVFPPDGGEPTVEFHGTENEEEFFGSPGDPGTLCDLLAP